VTPLDEPTLGASGYRSILEALEEGVVVQNAAGEFVIWNAAAERILGLASDGMTGRSTMDGGWGTIREDGSPLPGEKLPAMVTLRTGRQQCGVIVGVHRPDGELRWLSVTSALVRLAEFADAAVVVTFADITDRRLEERQRLQAEEQFRHAFDAAPVGMAVLALTGRVLRANGAFARLTGLPPDVLVGRHVRDLVLPHDMPRLSGRARQLVAGEVTEAVEELSLIVHRGPPVWILMSATLVRDGDGRPAHFLVQMQDIEARKRAEERLRHLADHDPLTGLLNRRAFEQQLEQRVQSRRRQDGGALLLLDIDRFKSINDTLGHAAGDRVIAAVGRALAEQLRASDVQARLGGDEFAVLLADVGEREAGLVAEKLRARVRAETYVDADGRVRHITASIGVALLGDPACRTADSALVQADSAMYAAKAAGRDGWRLAAGTAGAGTAVVPPPVPSTERPGPDAERLEARLRKRNRQLALASTLGSRLSGMTDEREVIEATVDELHLAFGYFLCAAIRIREDDRVEAAAVRGAAFEALGLSGWSQPRGHGVIGRCLREQRPMLVGDTNLDRDYEATQETPDVCSELVVPLWVDGEVWGAINVEEMGTHAFDEDDVRLLVTVADQVGAALRSARLYERLERAYLGTAEALAAALEAKDAYTADHARSIVDLAEHVGRRLGLEGAALRDLRFAAALHDIGKLAVPEAILNKPGPLDPEERAVMERHTIVGEQILAPVEFLADVASIVRHEHERWDGAGYPDRLAGDAIPLASRIILACDAYHAMTSDRPYRRALGAEAAVAELLAGAGTQFDPRVVRTLVAELRGDEPAVAGETAPAGRRPALLS
jgi:diguanylate cyclase (GGDEF)-like protein/PAS domain S-box-containing protein